MKQQLIELSDLIHAYCDLQGKNFQPMYTTIGVIVHNMAFNTDENSKWDDYDKALDVLERMAKFCSGDHAIQWMYMEAKMIIDVYFMSKEQFVDSYGSGENFFGQAGEDFEAYLKENSEPEMPEPPDESFKALQ